MRNHNPSQINVQSIYFYYFDNCLMQINIKVKLGAPRGRMGKAQAIMQRAQNQSGNTDDNGPL